MLILLLQVNIEKVMIIGIDVMTSILDYKDRDTCVIFGDGGGGVILEPCDQNYGIIDSILHMDGMEVNILLFLLEVVDYLHL